MNDRFAHVGKALKYLRERRGVEQKTLARSAGMAAGALSAIEQGRTQPRLTTLGRVVDALGVSLAELQELLDEVGGRPPEDPGSAQPAEVTGVDLHRYLASPPELHDLPLPGEMVELVRAQQAEARRRWRRVQEGLRTCPR